MISLILAFALSNCIAGRIEDITGKLNNKRLYVAFLRVVVPALAAGSFASSWYVGLAVLIGSAFWFPWGYSFSEINGVEDNKYPKWVREIGYAWFPPDLSSDSTRKRGILMKGIRGGYDILTFALLIPVGGWGALHWFGTLLMGVIYWACGRIFPARFSGITAELAYGGWRGFLIGACVP